MAPAVAGEIISGTQAKLVSGIDTASAAITSSFTDDAQSLFLTRAGNVMGWGKTGLGTLGVKGKTRNDIVSNPVQINQLSNINRVIRCDVGNGVLALKNDGSVWTLPKTWGSREADDPTTIEAMQLPGLERIEHIYNGAAFSDFILNNFTCEAIAVDKDGSAFNVQVYNEFTRANGPFDFTTNTKYVKATKIEVGLPAVKKVECKGIMARNLGHTSTTSCVALDTNEYVWTWGNNVLGILGEEGTTKRETAKKIDSLTNIINIWHTGPTAFALSKNGVLYSWGGVFLSARPRNSLTQTIHTTPGAIANIGKVIDFYYGGLTIIALNSDGALYGWGENIYGELGDGGASTGLWEPMKLSNIPINLTQ